MQRPFLSSFLVFSKLGVLIARISSGIVTQHVGWRNIYWIAPGFQCLMFLQLLLFIPDYSSVNPDSLNYLKLLWSTVRLITHEPLLIQACLVGFLTLAIYTSFWTTLTFVLASPPYEYSSLVIGLFAFNGIAGICVGPLFARYVSNKFQPLYSIIFSELIYLISVTISTYTGKFTVGGPILQAFAIDLGLQMSQAQRSVIQEIAPSARNQINIAYMVSLCLRTAYGNGCWEPSLCSRRLDQKWGCEPRFRWSLTAHLPCSRSVGDRLGRMGRWLESQKTSEG